MQAWLCSFKIGKQEVIYEHKYSGRHRTTARQFVKQMLCGKAKVLTLMLTCSLSRVLCT